MQSFANLIPNAFAAGPTITFANEINPTLTNAGHPGDRISVSGSGFLTGDTSCTITGYPVASSTCNVISGTMSASSFTVGIVAPGTYPVTVRGTQKGDYASVSLTVLPYITSVTLVSPANNVAITGTYLTVSGTVVTSPTTDEKDVQVYIKVNSTEICLENATLTGAFSCNYQVEANGTYPFQAFAEGYVGGVNMTSSTNDMLQLISSTIFSFTASVVVQVPLVSGWNLISIPVVPANTAIGTVLASQVAGRNFTVIWSYQGGRWVDAIMSGGTLSGTLTTVQDGYGYWIYMTKADNLFVVGSIFPPPPSTPPSYPVGVGWNLIGFKPEPTIGSETVSTYLTSLGTNYDPNNVLIYTASSASWTRAAPSYYLTPGTALWIYVYSATTLHP